MLSFRTPGFQGYAVRYSPFFDSTLAVAASSNFGLVGNGRLYLLLLSPAGITSQKHFDTQDSLFDLAFSESHSNHIAAACGDGAIKLFDSALPEPFPIASWKEHGREVFSLSWNLADKRLFASSSWDGAVKVWAPDAAQSLRTLDVGSCTYAAAWQPSDANTLAAVSSDGFLRLFDMRAPETAATVAKARVSQGEVLCMDWNKYRPTLLATGGVDRVIRTWDMRNPATPVVELPGHDYAVRRLAWSPHWPDVLISGSYDMSVRAWSDGSGVAAPAGGRMLAVMDRHTEFVAGLDWCLFGGEGWAASTGWDEMVWVLGCGG
ncbi:WD40-repeat-containing domain protein [Geopyxis carbonaria]|nr:WD40-repeat-containing domain protein [Geopyxis carbonaria]